MQHLAPLSSCCWTADPLLGRQTAFQIGGSLRSEVMRVQVKSEAVAAAQERLEASKAALEQRREELLAKEAQLKDAARAAEAAASAAAAQDDRLRAREVTMRSRC